MGNGNYMCLSCGHFYKGESGRQCAQYDQCPKCKGTYFVDNVIEDIPPVLSDEKEWQIQRLEKLGL